MRWWESWTLTLALETRGQVVMCRRLNGCRSMAGDAARDPEQLEASVVCMGRVLTADSSAISQVSVPAV